MTVRYRKLLQDQLKLEPDQIKEYPSSFVKMEGDEIFLCKIDEDKMIVAVGQGAFHAQLNGEALTDTIKLCPLTHQNRLVLNQFLPYTSPSAFGRETATIGLGDRLGIATPGHIRSMQNSSAKPVLAQQSKRELALTGRNYDQVLDDVCFAVFQEGYQGGFGADGDHLKEISDIEEALQSGYSMITLDCSEQIGRGIEMMTTQEAEAQYLELPEEYRLRVENSYLSKGFRIGQNTYIFNREELIRCALIYQKMLEFTSSVFHDCLRAAGREIDFELSIDETESVTTAHGHLFVALELEHQNVEVTSLAPRFIGEFQKGIDYIGDLREFENQFRQHAAIADHFGYKLSIHSGSDKFSVFPMIGDYTGGRLHLKTSGTNWLEALGTIAEKNPVLYRKMHQKALDHFNEAKKFYHVSAEPEKVMALSKIQDEELPSYLKENNSRQLLHITYGFILSDPEIRNEFYHTLNGYEENYYERILRHIGRHLELVGLTI